MNAEESLAYGQVGPAETKSFSEPLYVDPVISSTEKDWSGIVLEKYALPACEFPNFYFKNITVLLFTKGSCSVEATINGQRHKETLSKNDIYIFPSGFEDREQMSEGTELITISLAPTFVADFGDDIKNPDSIEIVPHNLVRDPLIKNILLSLESEAKNKDGRNRLYVDSLSQMLAAHVLRKYSTLNSSLDDSPAGLSRYKLKRATEYINDNLKKNLKLKDISSVIGMSPYYFARKFKESTGLTPHQYVIQQRIELAKNLLEHTELPIVQVAFDSGFSSQSHLAAHFRIHTSTTPKKYRQDQ